VRSTFASYFSLGHGCIYPRIVSSGKFTRVGSFGMFPRWHGRAQTRNRRLAAFASTGNEVSCSRHQKSTSSHHV